MGNIRVKNNINCVTANKEQCFACNACFNVCPVKAISMEADVEGFLYPIVNDEICINCELCKKVCPFLNKYDASGKKSPNCYAVMADDKLRAVSSSGGFFSLMADWILEQNGYICGVVWDDNGKAIHAIINNKSELYKMRGSKYVQSDMNNVSLQIKDLLDTGNKVLFTGTPCQVAGLLTFLKKDYEHLFTLDLICHGVPSPLVWKKYLEETTKMQEDEHFIDASFRSKEFGWGANMTITTSKNKYTFFRGYDTYLNAFLKKMCLRPACGKCEFTTKNRCSDMTIGDYWKVERFDTKLNDKKGTSAVLIQSKKAQKVFDRLMHKMQVCVKTPIEYLSFYNITLRQPHDQHPNRKTFFKLLAEDKNIKSIVDYCLTNKYDCAIMNIWNANNYGGLLTCYALQETIKKMGFNPKVINYIPTKIGGTHISNFAQKYLNLTKFVYNRYGLAMLNDETDTFIVGSDCVWCNMYPFEESSYQFSYTTLDKKRISYAPSFGNKFFVGNKAKSLIFKYYLQQFDHVSTRETFGVDICKNEFDVDATCVLDPVF